MSKTHRTRRSAGWFTRNDKEGFFVRSWLRNQGTPGHMFDGRPVIGICNTWSELTPCNGHLRDLAQNVKNGVYEAGGYPLEFPVMSLGETLMRPRSMLCRDVASMEVEESIRANPLCPEMGSTASSSSAEMELCGLPCVSATRDSPS